MTVAELIAELEKMPQDAELIVQKDSEGNGYSPLAGAEVGIYVANKPWSGEFYDLLYSADDNCMEEDEWEELKSGPKAVVLYPIR